LENKKVFSISRDLFNKYNLKERKEISIKEYQKIMKELILSAAYYYLARKDYTKKELSDKLIKRYGEKELVMQIVNFLEIKNFINDYEFAKRYIENSKEGIKKIELKLYYKGISKEIIQEFLKNKNQDEDILNNWLKLSNKDFQKKVMSLLRKGFKYSDIKRVISNQEKIGRED
jgi:regulatory protein